MFYNGVFCASVSKDLATSIFRVEEIYSKLILKWLRRKLEHNCIQYGVTRSVKTVNTTLLTL